MAEFNLKADPVKASITDLAPETVEKIFDYTRDDVASVCLALTCKRLFFIFDKNRSKVEEARCWNNTSGPWKQKLMLLLAAGWIPQEKMKLCLGCWRFAPFGPSSEETWKIMQMATGCSKKRRQWEYDWEDSLWLKGLPAHDVKDERVRCPMCVLYDQDLLLTTKSHWKSAKFGNRLGSCRDADVVKPPSRTARRGRAKEDVGTAPGITNGLVWGHDWDDGAPIGGW